MTACARCALWCGCSRRILRINEDKDLINAAAMSGTPCKHNFQISVPHPHGPSPSLRTSPTYDMTTRLHVLGTRVLRRALTSSQRFPLNASPRYHGRCFQPIAGKITFVKQWRNLTSTPETPDSAADAAERGLRILREHSDDLQQGGLT